MIIYMAYQQSHNSFIHLESKLDCAICKEEFTLGSDYIEMPCKHVFDKECILQWLAIVRPPSLLFSSPPPLFSDSNTVVDKAQPILLIVSTLIKLPSTSTLLSTSTLPSTSTCREHHINAAVNINTAVNTDTAINTTLSTLSALIY